jgi:hypothetical protein
MKSAETMKVYIPKTFKVTPNYAGIWCSFRFSGVTEILKITDLCFTFKSISLFLASWRFLRKMEKVSYRFLFYMNSKLNTKNTVIDN